MPSLPLENHHLRILRTEVRLGELGRELEEKIGFFVVLIVVSICFSRSSIVMQRFSLFLLLSS